MSWLTSASVANIRRGVQGYGTPTSPPLLYSNFHNTQPSQSGQRPSESIGSSTARDNSNNHSFEDPILDESPLTRNIRGPIQLTHPTVGESGVQTINILSQNVKIRPVDNASFRSLMDLKEDVIKAIQNGQGVDRNIHLTTIAKQSIEDAVEEAYNKRNETLAREGGSLLPPRSRNDWQHLGDSSLS